MNVSGEGLGDQDDRRDEGQGGGFGEVSIKILHHFNDCAYRLRVCLHLDTHQRLVTWEIVYCICLVSPALAPVAVGGEVEKAVWSPPVMC